MLSFLHERRFEDSSIQNSPGITDEAGAGDAEQRRQQEYLTVAAKGKAVRKSTALLAVLFGVGLLCLWFMIKKSAPATATAAAVSTEETQIEAAITRLMGVKSEMFNRMDEIVNKFYEFSSVQQVCVDELVKNPFHQDRFLSGVKANQDAGERKVDIEQTEDFELLGIMRSDEGGTGRCCVIDDRILYEGDSIRGFKVCQIGDSFVKLESEGVELVLKLSE